jgi:uncharacterized Zn finger protein (UPF0148 family)
MVKVRNIAIIALLIFNFYGSSAAFATTGNDLIKSDSVAGIYINADLIMQQFKAFLPELDKVDYLDRFKSELNFPMLAEKEIPSVAHLVVKSLDHLKDTGIFNLSGGFWATFDENLNPSILVEAQIKPKLFFEFIKANCPAKLKLLKPFIEKENEIAFKIPLQDGTGVLSFLPQAILFYEKPNQSPGKQKSEWKFFIEKAGKTGILCAADFNFVKVANLIEKRNAGKNALMCAANLRACLAAKKMYLQNKKDETSAEFSIQELKQKKYLNFTPVCPEKGLYQIQKNGDIRCSVHGDMLTALNHKADLTQESQDPRIKAFRRVRLSIEPENFLVELKINDKDMREQWLAIAKYQLMVYKQLAQKKLDRLPEDLKEKTSKILSSIQVDISGNWLRAYAKNIDVIEMLKNIVGSVIDRFAKISSPQKVVVDDPERRACLAIQDKINMAIEDFEMDHETAIKSLDLDLLVKEKYLDSNFNCPAGGHFRLRLNSRESSIECSKHGF